MNFSQATIQKNLRLLIVISLLVTLSICFFGLFQLNWLNQATNEILSKRMPSIQHLTDIKNIVANHRMKMYKHILLDEPVARNIEEKEMQKFLLQVDINLKLYTHSASTTLEKTQLAAIKKQLKDYTTAIETIIALSRQNMDKEAAAIIFTSCFEEYNTFNLTLTKLINYNLIHSYSAVKKSGMVFNRGIYFISFLTIGFCVLILSFGLTIVSSISRHFNILALSDSKFRAILESSSEANFFLDKDYLILSINKSGIEKIKKIFKKEIKVGDNFLEYVPDEQKQEFLKNCNIALQGTEITQEHNFNNDGEIVWFRRYYYPVVDSSSNIIGVAINSENITDKKNSEHQIKSQLQTLSEISFIQSHEVRGPVATLLGLTALFNHQNPQDAINAVVIEKIDITTKNLDRIVHEIISKTNL